ncbi:MAG: hypothetical protein U1E50_13685 [Caulobacteraceae bacterium]
MNPELERNLWLEAGPRRLAWAGVILLVLYGMGALIGGFHPEQGAPAPGVAFVGVGVFIFSLLWAARTGGGAVLTEIADRTWDFQRLSALGPWSMTWGKLAGAASLAGLCALSGIVMSVLGAGAAGGPSAPWHALYMAGWLVLLPAGCMTAALVGVRKARAEGRIAQSGAVLFGLIMGVAMLCALLLSTRLANLTNWNALGSLFGVKGGQITWWGETLQAPAFQAISVCFFAACALIGSWRLMRLELQMRNSVFVFAAFLIIFGAWVAGFVGAQFGWAGKFAAAGLIFFVSAYASAFAEPADRVHLSKFGEALMRFDIGELFTLTPAVVVAAKFAVIAAIATAVLALMGQGPANVPLPALASALVAFMARDLGVIAFFRFGPRPQRGDFGSILALVLLYGVGAAVGGMFGEKMGAAFFIPSPDFPMISVASGAAQAILVWFVAIRRMGRPEVPAD